MVLDIDERFAYITCGKCPERFQVLIYDEENNPIDWDEQATATLYYAHMDEEHGGLCR